MTTNLEKVGPFGGNGGHSFNDSGAFVKSNAPITSLTVFHGWSIDAIKVNYVDGTTVRNGGNSGTPTTVTLADGEYIQGADVRYGRVVDSLTLHSNTGRTFSFGGSGGVETKSVSHPGLALLYLHGYSGSLLDSIGFVFGPYPKGPEFALEASPGFGCTGGTAFNDFMHLNKSSVLRLSKITVRSGWEVDSIATVYDNSTAEEAEQMDGGGGGTASVFELEDNECITPVTVKHGLRVDGVQFHTSLGRSSPMYGGRGGPKQETYGPPGKVLYALFGRAGWTLDQLGFYFAEKVSVKVELIDVDFKIDELKQVAENPKGVVSVVLKNETDSEQFVESRKVYNISTSDTVTTSKEYSTSQETSVTATTSFDVVPGVVGAEVSTAISFGTGFSVSFSTASTVTETKENWYTFIFKVPPRSNVRGTGSASEINVEVPWTGRLRVWYTGESQPRVEGINGSYTGVSMSSLVAEFEQF